MSLFLSLEGLDSSGKCTQAQKLYEHFVKAGRDVMKFDLPKYESITGQMIKDHLKGLWHANVDQSVVSEQSKVATYATNPETYLFQCCQLVNRMECLPDALWKRTIDHGDDVFIADRYNASAYAYGMAFGLDFDWLVQSHRNLPQPDINIFLDVSVEESFRRRPERRDNYEKNGPLLERVRQCYLNVFERLGSSYVVIDAQAEVDDVFKRIIAVLNERNLV